MGKDLLGCLVLWFPDSLVEFHMSLLHIRQVFDRNMDRDKVVLLAARAARLDNQDAIDAAIVNMLSDPKEVEFKDSLFMLILNISLFFYIRYS